MSPSSTGDVVSSNIKYTAYAKAIPFPDVPNERYGKGERSRRHWQRPYFTLSQTEARLYAQATHSGFMGAPTYSTESPLPKWTAPIFCTRGAPMLSGLLKKQKWQRSIDDLRVLGVDAETVQKPLRPSEDENKGTNVQKVYRIILVDIRLFRKSVGR